MSAEAAEGHDAGRLPPFAAVQKHDRRATLHQDVDDSQWGRRAVAIKQEL
jgi:hypothetical protein